MKILKYFLTGIQVLLALLWLASGFGGDGLDPYKLNILPIPNFGDIFLFIIFGAIIYGIQKLKVKLGIGEDFSF